MSCSKESRHCSGAGSTPNFLNSLEGLSVSSSASSPLVAVGVSRHPVRWSPVATALFRLEARWTCHSSKPGTTWRDRCDVILATDLPFTVIPVPIQRSLDLVESPEPRWRGPTPDWFGVPCRIVRAQVWFPTLGPSLLFVPFELVVQLPQTDLPDTPPFILLGNQFLVEHRARIQIDANQMAPEFPCGQIIFP